jgi:hypothetical protein
MELDKKHINKKLVFSVFSKAAHQCLLLDGVANMLVKIWFL